MFVCNKISKVQKIKETRYLLTKWKLCEEKNDSRTAKPRKFTIQRQSKLQSTRTHKTYVVVIHLTITRSPS